MGICLDAQEELEREAGVNNSNSGNIISILDLL
jgi:hypothetical protein